MEHGSHPPDRTELGQTTDNLVDCLPLRNVNIVYKEKHTWAMEYIGGSNVFNFRQIFSQVGMLTKSCARPFRQMQFVVTDNDFVVHDGNQAESVLDKRARRWLFQQIDSDNYERSFVLADYRNREMVFFYPSTGASWPDKAFVWNWQDNSLYPRDLGKSMARGTTNILPAQPATAYSAAAGTYADQQDTFAGSGYNAAEQYMVTSQVSANQAVQHDKGEDYGGTVMSVYCERSYLPLDKDAHSYKRILRVLPWIEGTNGDTVTVTAYTRSILGGSRASSAKTFTIGTDYKVDFLVSGRVFDIRFEYSGTNPLKVYGYDVEWYREGRR